jgi:hypothetical protein
MLNNDALIPASSPKTSSKQETPIVTPELFKGTKVHKTSQKKKTKNRDGSCNRLRQAT